MKQMFQVLLSFLLITAILLTSCAANDGVPKEAKELFQKYMDACATDMHEALKYVRTVTDIVFSRFLQSHARDLQNAQMAENQ